MFRKSVISIAMVGVAATWAASLSAPVQAQTATLEEVVVTARKRSESLQDVPIAVAAFTEATIRNAGIDRPQDFISLTPNVTIVDSANVGDTQVSIRGIVSTRDAESTFAYIVDGVLATNPNAFNEELVDVAQIEILKGPQGALYGRNAVAGAILVTTKEPTNELEGKLKISVGSQNREKAQFVVSGPLVKDKLLGRLTLSHSKTDGFFSNAFTGESDSVDYLDDRTVRGRLIWNANEDLRFDLKAGYSEVKGGAINFNADFAIPEFAANLGPAFFADVNNHDFIFAFNVPGENKQETKEISLKMDWDLGGMNLTAILAHSDLEEYLLSDGTSASFYGYEITDQCLQDRATLNNAPWGADRTDLFGEFFAPFGVFPPDTNFAGVYGPYTPTACDGYQYQERNQKDTSFELRLASSQDQSLRWVAGVYGADIEREVIVTYGQDKGEGFLRQSFVPSAGPNPTDLMFSDMYDTGVLSAFGQLEFDITESLELSLAARYDQEDRDVTNQVPAVAPQGENLNSGQWINPAFNVTGGEPIEKRSKTFSQFQPKVSLMWKATDTVNLYVDYGVGFRSGGFNSVGSEALLDFWFGDTCPYFLDSCVNGPGVPVDAGLNVKDEYDKEVTTSFEIGTKMEFLDSRLRVNAAIFQTQVDDSQFFEFFAGPFGLLRAVTTVDEVEINGFELDFNALLMDNWSLYGGVGLLESEIKKNENRPLSEGNNVPQAPEQTFNLGTQVDFPIGDRMNLMARLDYQYIGDMWFHTLQGEATPNVWRLFDFTAFGIVQEDIMSDMSKAKRDAYGTIDGRVSLRGDTWSVTAWGRNLTDENYLQEVIPAPEFGGSFIHPTGGRSYGVDFELFF
ncbi:MAG: TonB-dependent receptor [Pseudomonadales bacterium]